MPTNLALSNVGGPSPQAREMTNLIPVLFLIPLIACLGSVALSIESTEFAAAILFMATQ
jgi:hypothetical protein